jgi:RNA polymerase sigma-70 factor (ECF subfamily)
MLQVAFHTPTGSALALPAILRQVVARRTRRRGAETCASLCGNLVSVPERSTVKRVPELHPARVHTAEFRTRPSDSPADHGIDDAALARAGMIGQPWAHREIWYRFAPMAYALLRRALGARRDQEDLLQEVFLRVFHRLDTLQNPAALRSFVYSFAIRVIREEIRRHRIRSRLAAFFPSQPAEASVPHVDFESRELLARVRAALDDMPGRKRAVFVLRRFDGMELAEIATNLDLSLATVKRDLEQANQYLAKTIHRAPRLRRGLAVTMAEPTNERARERG